MLISLYRIRVIVLEDDSEIYSPQVWRIVGWYNIDGNGNIATTAARCNTRDQAKDIIELHKGSMKNRKIKKIRYEDVE
jgi:hypothetical protein